MLSSVSLVFAPNKYVICSKDFFRKSTVPSFCHGSPKSNTMAITLPWLQLEIKPVIKH